MTSSRSLSLALAGALAAASPALAQQRPREGDLKVGDPAPAFVLRDVTGTTAISLADLRGRPVVLIFGSCT